MDQYLRAYPPSAPSTPGDLETGRQAPLYPPPPPPAHGLPILNHHQAPQPNTNSRVGWAGNDPGILLVVAMLITALTFLLGTGMPGGYWPQDTPSRDGRVTYRAGDPVMRDLHRPRYWVFRAASWAGVASSMAMTVSLLVRMPVASRHVHLHLLAARLRGVADQAHLSLDVIACLAVLAFLGFIICNREENRARLMRLLCCGGN